MGENLKLVLGQVFNSKLVSFALLRGNCMLLCEAKSRVEEPGVKGSSWLEFLFNKSGSEILMTFKQGNLTEGEGSVQLTSLDQLLLILKTYFVTKQAALMRGQPY